MPKILRGLCNMVRGLGGRLLTPMTPLPLFVSATLLPVVAGAVDVFEIRKNQRLAECLSIPEAAYSTGLLFNPAGYKTYFHRSECLQRLAVDERDAQLCEHVRERKSWFFDGSAISAETCRARVGEELAGESRELEQFRQVEPYRIDSLAIRRNGNGKDYDLLLDTEGEFSHRYDFRLTASHPGLSEPVRILENSYHLGPTTGTLHLFLRAIDLERQLGSDWLTREWQMSAILALTRDGANRFWYQRIPEELRSDSQVFPVIFANLEPWAPREIDRRRNEP